MIIAAHYCWHLSILLPPRLPMFVWCVVSHHVGHQLAIVSMQTSSTSTTFHTFACSSIQYLLTPSINYVRWFQLISSIATSHGPPLSRSTFLFPLVILYPFLLLLFPFHSDTFPINHPILTFPLHFLYLRLSLQFRPTHLKYTSHLFSLSTPL